jgi:integrase/recombinase XerD
VSDRNRAPSAAPSFLSSFLRDHLPRERGASRHTCEAYAYSYQLLFRFAADRLKTRPSWIEIEQLDANLILKFLEHLETERGNAVRTRNARLAAIHSFFRYLEYRLPSCLDQARRIHAIPMKRADQALVGYLTLDEMRALLAAPDRRTQSGARDLAMLHLTFAAGLRVSELIGLKLEQLEPRTLASVHVLGKGRRERVLPLWKETIATIRAWLAVRPPDGERELFLNAAGRAMTRSGFEYILAKHAATATGRQPSLAQKRVTPHATAIRQRRNRADPAFVAFEASEQGARRRQRARARAKPRRALRRSGRLEGAPQGVRPGDPGRRRRPFQPAP